MILCRSALMLHLQTPSIGSQVLFQFKHAYSSFLCNSTSHGIRFFSLTRLRQRQSRTFGTAVAAVTETKGRDTFFAEENISWNSLGLSDTISQALSNIGLERPSLVQASSIPCVLSGKDIVIAAETGSGKTYSYLVPLIEKLHCSHYSSVNTASDQQVSPPRQLLLVLCPNVQLCEQVVRMANCLCGENGKPFVNVAAVCGRQGWPTREPDVIVSTPAALLNYVDRDKLHRMEFMRGVKHVVFDEADMLLCGSFQNKVIRLIHLLRYDEKLLSRSKESTADLPMESESAFLSHDASDGEEELLTEAISEEEDDTQKMVDVNNEAESIKRREWWRVRKIYERSKQYIFVAATLPVNGKKTAGGILKYMFPDAKWVSGNYLHCHNPRLEQRWIEVTVDAQVDELIKAVNQGFKSEDLDNAGGVSRTMVFANTVEAVEAIAKILLRSGIECLRYHKDCTLEERAKSLVEFQEKGGVLVCTDAAARGVDIRNVLHVIQADFATSAVDFLHRVGRTARAGQFGLVTSMYTESNRELVDAVRRAGKLGQPVETAFSRKRSFRNKLKKKGANKARDSETIKENALS
ncbi:hypothetical protein L6164_027202 [Bauhinia variegata]|uniref:Uncharacterized protein n=1 Tax=Bauhinia variegata TaxID=167791 RepID=A0ACB9LTE0_BAUVA|nr:hypothetical protein L6164_027202 [Bauhinia variegata]